MLTLQYIPHHEIESLNSEQRIEKLLKPVLENKIVLMEGRLKSEEEAELIRRTMEKIDNDFKGIELSVVDPDETNKGFFKKIKESLANMLLGERHGLTIIGPANIIKEIRQDPDMIQLFAQETTIHKKKKQNG